MYLYYYSKQEFEERIKGLVLDEDNGETTEQYPWKTTEDEMLLLKEKVNVWYQRILEQLSFNILFNEPCLGAIM